MSIIKDTKKRRMVARKIVKFRFKFCRFPFIASVFDFAVLAKFIQNLQNALRPEKAGDHSTEHRPVELAASAF
ncbi:MAG: hypothetical protein MUD08_10475 [Cytophagales bacterium]|nr:hypothetical protein [Cytophagales bacterium]